MSFLKPDGTSFHYYTETFLGTGTDSMVLCKGPYALKIPEVRDTSDMPVEYREDEECCSDCSRQMLEIEKAVYPAGWTLQWDR